MKSITMIYLLLLGIVVVVWITADTGKEEAVLVIMGITYSLSFALFKRVEPEVNQTQKHLENFDRNRTRLLDSLTIDYKNRLKTLLVDDIKAELKLNFVPNMAQNRTASTVDGEQREIINDADLYQLFRDSGGKLLILGNPGTGKTTSLLRLATHLANDAKDNPSAPVPILFQLSNWALERKPIEEWIIQALKDQFGMKLDYWQTLIDPNHAQILFLFDGLDEVKNFNHRVECIQQINTFSEHFTRQIVVCSRINEYEQAVSLGDHLTNLKTSVKIKPLTDTQIEEYLAELGDQAIAVKLLLADEKAQKQSTILDEIARIPLLLNVLVLAYQNGEGIEALLKLGKDGRKELIFDKYIRNRFERKEREFLEYSRGQILYWLKWLAEQMQYRFLQEFEIRRLQPSWLEVEELQQKYLHDVKMVIFLSVGMINGIVFGILGTIVFNFLVGLLASLMVGTISLWIVWYRNNETTRNAYYNAISGVEEPLDTIREIHNDLKNMLTYLEVANSRISESYEDTKKYKSWILDFGQTLAETREEISNLETEFYRSQEVYPFIKLKLTQAVEKLAGYEQGYLELCSMMENLEENWDIELNEYENQSHEYYQTQMSALHTIEVFFRANQLDPLDHDIVLKSRIRWRGRIAYRNVFITFMFGLFISYNANGEIVSGITNGMFYGIIYGLAYGFTITPTPRSKPNEDISNSLINGLRFWICIGLFFGLLFGRLGGGDNDLARDIAIGVTSGLSLGFAFGFLLSGGNAVIRHIILRSILVKQNNMPWNYAAFLDYCCDLRLLKRAGGGYQFMHRMLQEHIADPDFNPEDWA